MLNKIGEVYDTSGTKDKAEELKAWKDWKEIKNKVNAFEAGN